MQEETITKKNIRTMLDRFYSATLKDELLSDFFIEALGDEMISDTWQTHLNLLTNFWAAMLLGDKSYQGQPIKPHMHMPGLKRVTFERWLQLFSETVDNYYAPEQAQAFKSRGEIIANNFMKLLQI